jgi:arginine deiminase
MSTLKSVGHKLFKTELESHKVELANINDFTKKTVETENLYKQFNDVYSQLEKLVPSVIKNGDAYLKSLDDNMDMSNELFSKFKEIGLNWVETPEYKTFKNLMVKGDRSTIQTMVARVKNI